ncbi:MAG TPA: homoserine O-acetyltransferase [Fimbriimonadaceae bacterium]|nr:homoserine O-acetyltransferase [Fimbriimonadaceae bacterium]
MDPALFQENERLSPASDERKYLEVGPLDLEAGGHLPSVTVAYETWGSLSPAKDNAILICHALSGDSHAIGWWERLIGPGKAIDTDRYFVIGTNSLGGCRGTTGPASLADDGRPYQGRFPIITVRDMVDVQQRLVRELGIEVLLGVAGGSMGGMQALEWTLRSPGRVRKAFVTASCAAHSAMQIGFNETGRQAVMRDPKWNEGFYDPLDPPAGGLAVARMLGHLSFLSEAAFAAKFGRRLQDKPSFDYTFDTEFQVESYLRYQGRKFVDRFDANSFLYLTRAIDYYETTSLDGSESEYLFVSFNSDWLYPSHQSRELHEMALAAGCMSEWHDIDLPYGHDAFLLDGKHQGKLVAEFLGNS